MKNASIILAAIGAFYAPAIALSAPLPVYGVSIMATRSEAGGMAEQQQMIIYQKSNERTILIVYPIASESIKTNLSNFSNPIFSDDGKYMYFNTMTNHGRKYSVHRLDIKTGEIDFFSSGRILSLISKGELKSCLIIGDDSIEPESIKTKMFEVIMSREGRVIGSKRDLEAFM